MIDLQIIWTAVASKYSDDSELIQYLWDEILTAYRQPERTYHNDMHLIFMFTLADSVRAEFDDRDAVYFAIFYHDFIYDPERNDNEEKSAGVADDKLRELGVDDETRERCIRHILATEDHLYSSDPDTNFLLDLDLAILGADPDTFNIYSENLRTEYSVYPDSVYLHQRSLLLNQFLERPRIFHTQLFYETFEEKARINIQRELNTIVY